MKYWFLIIFGFISCKSTEKKQTLYTPDFKTPGPQAVVYKMKEDYSKFIFVGMNSDKTEIVSYPSPADFTQSTQPVKLLNGFWLDNKGLSVNSVCLNITIESYINSKQNLSVEEMQKRIKDIDPFVEFYQCGLKNAIPDIQNSLNAVIKEGKLKEKFKQLK